MEKCTEVMLHPQFLDILFAYKGKTTQVFRDVLGLFEINHISLTFANTANQLLSLSSTPALEFNLFSKGLWRYDQTYHPSWFKQFSTAIWQRLYQRARYDELYFIKQIKHTYPLGLSLAQLDEKNTLIYSIASHKEDEQTREIFAHEHAHFYKIGQYCAQRLMPLFLECNQLLATLTAGP